MGIIVLRMDINDFVLLLVFMVISGGMLVGLLYLEDFLSPKIKSTGMGSVIIESAERPVSSSRLLGFQYYFYAIIFVVVEAMLVFLLLWSQSVAQIGAAVFVGVGVSLLFLLLLVRYFMDKADEVL